jgi:hypothetical protein
VADAVIIAKVEFFHDAGGAAESDAISTWTVLLWGKSPLALVPCTMFRSRY